MPDPPADAPDPVTGAVADPARPPDDPVARTLSQLADLKAEVGTLRAQSRQSSRPWYREASTVVAVVALMFSIAATVYTAQESARQSDRAARTELGQLIQRLAALPKENADLEARYAQNRAAWVTLSGSMNTENLALAQQAADVIRQVPDQVSATEYLAVASALELSSSYRRSEELVDAGLRVTSDLTTREGLLRLKAKLLFAGGRLDLGRARLEDALDLWRDEPAQERARAHAYTEILWAGLERRAGHCPDAASHLSRAQAAIGLLAPGASREQLAQTVGAGTRPCP
jgi:hypothetical protein